MRKIKFIFAFLLLSLLITSCYPSHTNAQDYKLGLGRAWLRYDADSNKIRLGSITGTPPKFARESNLQLFDLNSSQFSWSSSTGLNLQDPLNHDSLWIARMTIKKDTGDGETSVFKSRTFTLKKSTWFNNYFNYDIQWHYRSYSAGTIDYEDSCYAVNEAALIHTNTDFTLSTSYTSIQEINLPVAGTYLIFINYDYDFSASAPLSTVVDEISVRLLRFPSTALGSATEKFQFVAGVETMFRGTAGIVITCVTPGPDETLYLQGKCTANSSGAKIIRQLTANYLLVK